MKEPFFISCKMNLLISLNTCKFFQNFRTILTISFTKLKNIVTFRSNTWKILECDIESCSKIVLEIRNVSFTFQNFYFVFKTLKKIEKIHMNLEQSANSF